MECPTGWTSWMVLHTNTWVATVSRFVSGIFTWYPVEHFMIVIFQWSLGRLFVVVVVFTLLEGFCYIIQTWLLPSCSDEVSVQVLACFKNSEWITTNVWKNPRIKFRESRLATLSRHFIIRWIQEILEWKAVIIWWT